MTPASSSFARYGTRTTRLKNAACQSKTGTIRKIGRSTRSRACFRSRGRLRAGSGGGLSWALTLRSSRCSIAEEKALPFEPLVPNEKTMDGRHAGDPRLQIASVQNAEDLLRKLNEGGRLNEPAASLASDPALPHLSFVHPLSGEWSRFTIATSGRIWVDL